MVKGPIFGFFLEVALNMEMYATCPPLSGLFHQKAAAGPGQKCAPAVLMPPRPAPARGLVRARPQPRHRHRLRQRHDDVARDTFTQPRHPQPPNTANDYEKIGFHYFN